MRKPLAAVLAVTALVTVGCGKSDTTKSSSGASSGAQSVTIALGGPFSGADKPTGDQIRAGAKLAADEINNSGGISGGPLKGAKITFREFDDGDEPARAAANMRSMVDDTKILAFVGSGLSDASVAMAPVASQAGFSMLSAYGSSEKVLTAATGKKTVFVVPPTFPAYAFSVADQLVKSGRTRPALLHATGTYGDGIASLFGDRLKSKNISVVGNETFAFTDTDFRTQLAKLKSANPDSLVVVGLAGIDALVLKQADELGLKVPVFDPGGITNSDTFLKAAGALANGVVGNTPIYPARSTPATKSLKDAYTKATGDSVIPDPAVFTYEGVRAVAAALVDGAKGRDDLADHLHEITIADTGVGTLKFAPDGSRLGGRLYLYRINNGTPEYFTSYEQTAPMDVKEVALGG